MELRKEIAVPLHQLFAKFFKNLAENMHVLISAEVKSSFKQASLLTGDAEIFPVFENEWALAFVQENGTNSGDMHLLFDVRSAIALSALMMMMEGSSLPDLIKRKEYSEDLQEAFGEIANVAMGVLNTLVEESLEGGHLQLENTVTLGSAEQPETLGGDLYIDVIANIAVGDFGTEILHVLVSKGLAEALAGAELESEEPPPEAAADDIDALIASVGQEKIDVSLSQLMTDPASRANENSLVSSAIAQMEKEGVRQIGVVRDGVLIRVISWGDLRQLMGPFYGTRAMSARDNAVLRIQLGKININQKLTSIPITGSPSQALDLVIEGDLKSLPVVDESGALRGFIPVRELLKLLRTRLH